MFEASVWNTYLHCEVASCPSLVSALSLRSWPRQLSAVIRINQTLQWWTQIMSKPVCACVRVCCLGLLCGWWTCRHQYCLKYYFHFKMASNSSDLSKRDKKLQMIQLETHLIACSSFVTLPLLHTLPYLYLLPPLLFFLLFTKRHHTFSSGQTSFKQPIIFLRHYCTCFCFSLKMTALASSSSCIFLRAASMASCFLATNAASLQKES